MDILGTSDPDSEIKIRGMRNISVHIAMWIAVLMYLFCIAFIVDRGLMFEQKYNQKTN